jgi:hypothetical protein
MLLLYSPVDDSGSWPNAAACRLMTEAGSDVMLRAFEVAIFNNQGWPGPLGNELEMSDYGKRAETIKILTDFAEKLNLDFPVVAAILRNAAGEQRRMISDRSSDDI